jgi:hypothetical protein
MRSCEVLRCLVVSREAKAGKSFFPESIAMLSTRIYHRILAAHRISCDAAYPITCSIRLLCEPLFLVNSLTLDQNASFFSLRISQCLQLRVTHATKTD